MCIALKKETSVLHLIRLCQSLVEFVPTSASAWSGKLQTLIDLILYFIRRQLLILTRHICSVPVVTLSRAKPSHTEPGGATSTHTHTDAAHMSLRCQRSRKMYPRYPFPVATALISLQTISHLKAESGEADWSVRFSQITQPLAITQQLFPSSPATRLDGFYRSGAEQAGDPSQIPPEERGFSVSAAAARCRLLHCLWTWWRESCLMGKLHCGTLMLSKHICPRK